jgi:hypothetical protein
MWRKLPTYLIKYDVSKKYKQVEILIPTPKWRLASRYTWFNNAILCKAGWWSHIVGINWWQKIMFASCPGGNPMILLLNGNYTDRNIQLQFSKHIMCYTNACHYCFIDTIQLHTYLNFDNGLYCWIAYCYIYRPIVLTAVYTKNFRESFNKF